LLATRRLGVSAIKNIARLKRAGFATARPYRGVFLTEKGEALAERVRIRHRLVVDVLCALGVPTESAEADAEGIEHFVSETTRRSGDASAAQQSVRRGPRVSAVGWLGKAVGRSVSCVTSKAYPPCQRQE